MAVCGVDISRKLLIQTSTADDDEVAADDAKARRIHSALEKIRSQSVEHVADDRLSVLDDLRSFANAVNALDLPQAAATSSSQQDSAGHLSYSDRLAQTHGDLKLLEHLVSQTFPWQPHHDSSTSDVVEPTHHHVSCSTFSSSATECCTMSFSRFLRHLCSQFIMLQLTTCHPDLVGVARLAYAALAV